MQVLLSIALESVSASVFLIPIFFLLNRYQFQNRSRTILFLLFTMYLSAVYTVAGLPSITYIRFDPHYNITPFAYMFSDLRSTLLNVVLFLPLGFFLPILWKKYRNPLTAVLFGFCTSLLIETLQIFTFRATDINDLMTNTVGTLLGYCTGILIQNLFPTQIPGYRKHEEFLVCGTAFAVMFFLQPFLSSLIWNLIY